MISTNSITQYLSYFNIYYYNNYILFCFVLKQRTCSNVCFQVYITLRIFKDFQCGLQPTLNNHPEGMMTYTYTSLFMRDRRLVYEILQAKT